MEFCNFVFKALKDVDFNNYNLWVIESHWKIC